jgi:hypothetical protein
MTPLEPVTSCRLSCEGMVSSNPQPISWQCDQRICFFFTVWILQEHTFLSAIATPDVGFISRSLKAKWGYSQQPIKRLLVSLDLIRSELTFYLLWNLFCCFLRFYCLLTDVFTFNIGILNRSQRSCVLVVAMQITVDFHCGGCVFCFCSFWGPIYVQCHHVSPGGGGTLN